LPGISAALEKKEERKKDFKKKKRKKEKEKEKGRIPVAKDPQDEILLGTKLMGKNLRQILDTLLRSFFLKEKKRKIK